MDVLTNAELFRRMERFQADDKSPWSWAMLAELVGMHETTLRNTFIYKTYPLSVVLQVRLSKALGQIERGEVTVMRNKDRSRFIQYNQTPKPRAGRSNKLIFEGGRIRVKPGIVNKNDYSQPTLLEQLED
jgi:AraC-like DNA-binding protein